VANDADNVRHECHEISSAVPRMGASDGAGPPIVPMRARVLPIRPRVCRRSSG
jgi:hypothetical protein